VVQSKALEPKGLRFGRGIVGKHMFRIREKHIAEHLVPLMTAKAVGAAKLDVVLRGVALSPVHAGAREVGLVLPRYSWEQLHDLARVPDNLGAAPLDVDPPVEIVRLKRKWVGEQLARLESLKLLRRAPRPGRRPYLIVLADDGSGRSLDDPDGTPGNSYVSISGGVIASGALAKWGGPELSFFLAAMIAERHEAYSQAARGKPAWPLGGGSWFRPLGWFADRERRRPTEHVRIPFSVPTLERGLARLENDGLVAHRHIYRSPHTGRRLSGPRNLYTNMFHTLDNPQEVLTPKAFEREIQQPDPDSDDE